MEKHETKDELENVIKTEDDETKEEKGKLKKRYYIISFALWIAFVVQTFIYIINNQMELVTFFLPFFVLGSLFSFRLFIESVIRNDETLYFFAMLLLFFYCFGTVVIWELFSVLARCFSIIRGRI